MKKSAEVYLTQDGKTYRLYANVEEQLCLDIKHDNGEPISATSYILTPTHKQIRHEFKTKKKFTEILICYNTYSVELIDCNLIRKYDSYGPTCDLQITFNKSNTVGMWHTLDWVI